jgi:fido (protein-threonine AMPylation protein)
MVSIFKPAGNAAAGEMNELTLEFLAFAEGRFLKIHPFRDFNGRTIRLFLPFRLDASHRNLACAVWYLN